MNRKHFDCETRYYNNSNNSIKLVMNNNNNNNNISVYLVAANVVPTSQILVTLIIEVKPSSETSVATRATRSIFVSRGRARTGACLLHVVLSYTRRALR
jgi:hypothetical protein